MNLRSSGWSREDEESLWGCLEVTDWDVLCNAYRQDIDELTGCITDYVHFCTDCMTCDMKKAAFRSGNKEKMKVQRELRSVAQGSFSRITSGRCGVA